MKTIVGVFAHPDDEAFGPGGTLAKFAKDYHVYLLCATKGESGKNSSAAQEKLHKIREKELLESAKILGIKKVYFLGFKDGALCNNMYHELAGKIKEKLQELRPEIIITFEPRGVSGHIDHIAVAMVTRFVFYQLPFVKKLLGYCISNKQRLERKNYFIYFPPGYKRSEVDMVSDTSKVWDTKVKAMKTHTSQLHDVERILAIQEKLPRQEYFLVLKKR